MLIEKATDVVFLPVIPEGGGCRGAIIRRGASQVPWRLEALMPSSSHFPVWSSSDVKPGAVRDLAG